MSAGTQLELAQDHEVQPVAGEVSGLVKLAVEQKVPVEVLERLVALQERVTERNARMAYIQALSDFQSEVGTLVKTKTVSFVSSGGGKVAYAYAPLDEIERKIRPILVKHGLSYTWDTAMAERFLTVTCRVMHVDGHSESSSFSCQIEKQAKMNVAQSTASTSTYGRRQSLTAALGLSTAETDVDGRTPEEQGEKISMEQLADLKSLMDEVLGQKTDRFYGWLKESLGVELLGDVPASAYPTVKSALEARRR